MGLLTDTVNVASCPMKTDRLNGCVMMRGNGTVLVKKTDNFETVFDCQSFSSLAFHSKAQFALSDGLCFRNHFLKLDFLKSEGSAPSYFVRQANPTGRNIISTVNKSANSRYSVDVVVVSPDDTVLAVSESLTARDYLVSSSLKVFLIGSEKPHFRLMNSVAFESEIIDVHFTVCQSTKGAINREQDGGGHPGALPLLQTRARLESQRLRELTRSGGKATGDRSACSESSSPGCFASKATTSCSYRRAVSCFRAGFRVQRSCVSRAGWAWTSSCGVST